ncbi:lytic murein transglycosylase B [Halioxenophilus sp. WMMB6]|uniref:lytic murein transglycosylase B n=1 Tax=Halioxenophilus sp. WMMB6 TaxID=3073815 RepID=UPI00295E4ACC|nr:lytic murein transglycosylase B [Halioxenophilus sp. WMMB6]
MFSRVRLGVVLVVSGLPGLGLAGDFSNHPETQKFIGEMVAEQQFDRAQLQAWFDQVERKQSVLDAIARPAEKVKPWKEYRQIFVTPTRIKQGVEFWRNNAQVLARAEQDFGVPKEIIVAILGVETRYGAHRGGYRVMDSLSTLAFEYPPRAAFFRKELKEFLLLAREQKKEPLTLMGSYAGAMGYGQFMPSSYRAYAYDYDGNGFTDIWDNPEDAIGSVANYFTRHGWQGGQPVVARVRVAGNYNANLLNDELEPDRTFSDVKAGGFIPLEDAHYPDPVRVFQLEGEHGAEFWLGMQNFYVITRYNRSSMYALAVFQLAQAVARDYQTAVGAL